MRPELKRLPHTQTKHGDQQQLACEVDIPVSTARRRISVKSTPAPRSDLSVGVALWRRVNPGRSLQYWSINLTSSALQRTLGRHPSTYTF
ncbi:MAG: hypothetical protein JWL65_5907 [Gammaproteobacteria bacterium]|nr:hypothetical protein [Gammaproteobacteria bacterium]